MLNKKGSEPQSSPDEQALQRRVDAMLDPRVPDPKPTSKGIKSTVDDKSLDIFEGKSSPVAIAVTDDSEKQTEPVKTAPEVPGKLLKKAGLKPVKASVKAPAPETTVVEPIEPASEEGMAADEAVDQTPETDAPPPQDDSPTALDDSAIDSAVDDIAAKEADALLAIQDTVDAHKAPANKVPGPGWKARLAAIVKNKWTWIIVAVILIAIFAVPITRYKLLGLVVKEPVTVQVMDDKTQTPVSNAVVDYGGATAKTNADGKATLKAAVGHSTLEVTKQYYQAYKSTYFTGFKAGSTRVQLNATGRQVPVTVLNKITGKPLADAQIKVLATTAKTDAKGRATIVLPATAVADTAIINLAGYNQAKVAIRVTGEKVAANTLMLVPSGHIYFLSNQSGNIDVVKTNLDGSDRKTVFAGTGQEDPNTTSLLASRDWRYLVLKAQHDTARPVLYLIDTSNDHVTSFDTSNATFTLVGWINHDFIYDLVSNTVGTPQAGHETIKSYDADHLQLNQLDQDQIDGSGSSYAYQNFSNFYIFNNQLAYTTQWYTVGDFDVSGKTATIRAIQASGQNKKDYQLIPANNVSFIQSVLYEPQAAYYAFYNPNTNQNAYYAFENQTVSASTSVTQNDFNRTYPTFLLSPSGKQTFWTELRDGKNSLFTGDDTAKNSKQVASQSDYSPYGWYSDNYLLVSKNSSELYILPAQNQNSVQPLKVTDYYKPAQTFTGYGYGYGGL